MMNTIFKYLTALLTGILLGVIFMLKKIKPVINADTYIESMDQQIKKMKQHGTNNEQKAESWINKPGRDTGAAVSKKEARHSRRERRSERKNNRSREHK